MSTARNVTDLAGRIYLAVLFLALGIGQIGAYAAAETFLTSHGVSAALLPGIIGVEIGGSLLVLLGWQTRAAAMLMAGFTFLNILMFRMHPMGSDERIVLLTQLADVGGFLILLANGAQGWSVDVLLARWRQRHGAPVAAVATPDAPDAPDDRVVAPHPAAAQALASVPQHTQKRAA